MSTAIANKNPHALAQKTIKEYLLKCEPALKQAMPSGFGTSQKVIQSVMIACHANDQLYRCDPMTIGACMIQSTMLRLFIGGPLGHAYIIPYKDVCTFQVGYKGFLQLAHNSGQIKAFYAHTRYANDEFLIELGTQPQVIHRPAKDRGEPVGYYAAFRTIHDGIDFEYMSLDQMMDHKKKYVRNRSKAWDEAFDEMARKTVIRRLAKRCPAATELQNAASLDEYGEGGYDQGLTHLVEGVPLPSRVGQTLSKMAGEDSRSLDEKILEALQEAGSDWDRFWKEHGNQILGNESGVIMSLGELSDEDKANVLEILQ